MKSLLLIVSWVQGGPYMHTQLLESYLACRKTAEISARIIVAQASTNMASPHNTLVMEKDPHTDEWRLLTGGIGREVARISCIAQ
jgi:hypothetical protein